MKHALNIIVVLFICICYGCGQQPPPGSPLGSAWYSPYVWDVNCLMPSAASMYLGNLRVIASKINSTCPTFQNGQPTGPSTNSAYQSEMLLWNTFNFAYGTVSTRVMGGGTAGTHPAIYLIDARCQGLFGGLAGNCPQYPTEIDIYEVKNSDPLHITQNMYTPGTSWILNSYAVTDVTQNWHTVTMVWSPGSLVFTVDGVTSATITNANVPSQAMYMLVGMFIGEYQIVDSQLPETMLVDYIRVQDSNGNMIFDDEFTTPTGVSITPSILRLLPSQTWQFAAQISGTTNTDVTWSASSGGSIDSAGLYTASATPGNYTVTATSVNDPSQSATASITVIASANVFINGNVKLTGLVNIR